MRTENASSTLGRLKKTHGSILLLNLDSPVCPSVLPLNRGPLREIDRFAMETLPLARPVPLLDLKPNGDGKPPPKPGTTLTRHRAIARFQYRSSGPLLVTFSKIRLDVSQNCATRQDYSSWPNIYCQLIVSQNCATRQDYSSRLNIYCQLLAGFL